MTPVSTTTARESKYSEANCIYWTAELTALRNKTKENQPLSSTSLCTTSFMDIVLQFGSCDLSEADTH